MGEIFGGGSAKRAAKEQAKATRDAAAASALTANYQAEASAQQMGLAQEQRSQQQYANDLLSTPMDSATVDLANPEGSEDDENDLLGRRRTTRDTYQSRTGSRGAGLNIP